MDTGCSIYVKTHHWNFLRFCVKHSKSMDWSIYDRDPRPERGKVFVFHSKLEFLWCRSYDSHGFDIRIENMK